MFGVFSRQRQEVGRLAYYGLYALQHRGQESCGVVVNDDGVFYSRRDLGLVSEVFSPDALDRLPPGRLALGHVRYGTTGGSSRANCQPIQVNHHKGKMALAHNGNLSNAFQLRLELERNGAIFHTTSDTETIAYIVTRERLTAPSIEAAVSRAMDTLEGAYSIVLMSSTKLIAARDPHGFRPLCYGKMEDGTYVVASESCALQSVGAVMERDIEPGEILVFSDKGLVSHREHCRTAVPTPCVFEHIYFARSDSVIDGVSVQAARMRAGEILARTYPVEADVVVGVPDSGLDAALGYSRASGIPYGLGFLKNKYIGRTFISPGQALRVNQVRIKLSPIRHTVEGRRVVLIDDSIVRGNTSARTVSLLREAGAREVHMRVSAPPFRYPCYYGTDVDSQDHLIACRHTVEEIAEMIGVDTLGYLPLEALGEMCGCGSCCAACFDGKYPTPVPEDTRKDRFEAPLSQRPPKNIE